MAPLTGFGKVPTYVNRSHPQTSPKIDVLEISCAARWLLGSCSGGNRDFASFSRNLGFSKFLGFFFDDEHIKRKFSKFFPNDKENISLDNWHQFEINNPNIFSSMYQFWVKKK